jgi:hypothetical protein
MERPMKFGADEYTVVTPTLCPVCNHHSEMKAVATGYVKYYQRIEGEAVFRCGFAGCQSHMIVRYGDTLNRLPLREIIPLRNLATEFPKAVKEISPTFIQVYAQAEEARQLRLAFIAGPGFRKAFEFLIKDYAISLKPERSEEIKQTFAAKVVDEFIGDPRIQAVARRALWIGNDETHYERKWEDKDIDDLVTLVKTTVSWIETDHQTKAYVQAMPDKAGR